MINITGNTSKSKNVFLKFFKLVFGALRFLISFHGIMFFGGYPYPERKHHLKYRRMKAIDKIFIDSQRVYVDNYDLQDRQYVYDRPEKNVLVFRLGGNWKRTIFSNIFFFLCVLRCDSLYFHSILPVKDHQNLMRFRKLNIILDVHSLDSERFDDNDSSVIKSEIIRLEQFAITHANTLIVTSDNMKVRLTGKYQEKIKAQFIKIPPISEFQWQNVEHTNKVQQIVIFLGEWYKLEQVTEIINFITKTIDLFTIRVFCSNPLRFSEILPPTLVAKPHLIVEQNNLDRIFFECIRSQFSLLICVDKILHRFVPLTDLINCLATNVIPIVDIKDKNDLKSLGIQTITLQNFIDSKIPNLEIQRDITDKNEKAFQNVFRDFLSGANQLRANTNLKESQSLKDRFIANNLYEGCDILVQVSNFLSGGLENVVLGINEMLMRNDYILGLLILGATGSAVERAKDSGATVYIRKYEHGSHEHFLKLLSPKLLLTHYSIDGTEISNDLGIPCVQVIHSNYMWFDKTQLEEFQKSFSYTNLFVGVSEYSLTYSIECLGVPESKCVLIPNGIDVQRIRSIRNNLRPIEIRKKHGFNKNDFVFLSVAAITESKNIMGLVKAYHRALPHCQNSRLVIVGPTYSENIYYEFNSYLNDNNLNDRIIYLGHAKEAYPYYMMADVFVNASFFEGGPLVLLEAIAFDLPIISTKVGFAQHFKDINGISLIPPAVNIFHYEGNISQLSSNIEFETILSKSMIKTYRNPQTPKISPNAVDMMDNEIVYSNYLKLVNEMVSTGKFDQRNSLDLWTDHISN